MKQPESSVVITKNPADKLFIFYFTKVDVLEIHRLVRIHLLRVIKKAEEQLKDPVWMHDQEKKVMDKRLKKRRAGDRSQPEPGTPVRDDEIQLRFLFTLGKVNITSSCFSYIIFIDYRMGNTFLFIAGQRRDTFVLPEPPCSDDVSGQHRGLHQEDPRWSWRCWRRNSSGVHQGTHRCLVWGRAGRRGCV